MKSVYLRKSVWSKLFKFLDDFQGIHTKNRKKTKKFLSGVFWIMRTGAQWRELPKKYGRYRSVHKRYDQWSLKGVWTQMLEYFSQDADREWIMLDSTVVRAHPCCVGVKKGTQEQEGLGRSRGGFSSKIHTSTDALGNALKVKLTGGQRNDITQGAYLIEGIEGSVVIADKGYDGQAFISHLENAGFAVVIPPRRHWKTHRFYDRYNGPVKSNH